MALAIPSRLYSHRARGLLSRNPPVQDPRRRGSFLSSSPNRIALRHVRRYRSFFPLHLYSRGLFLPSSFGNETFPVPLSQRHIRGCVAARRRQDESTFTVLTGDGVPRTELFAKTASSTWVVWRNTLEKDADPALVSHDYYRSRRRSFGRRKRILDLTVAFSSLHQHPVHDHFGGCATRINHELVVDRIFHYMGRMKLFGRGGSFRRPSVGLE